MTEKECHELLTRVRWKGQVSCPACQGTRCRTRPKERRWRCDACGYTFDAGSRTIFHGTRVPLSAWFMAIVLLGDPMRRVSVRTLADRVAVNRNTAWRMTRRFEAAMGSATHRHIIVDLMKELL